MYESLSESKVQGEKPCLVGVSLDTYTRSTVSFVLHVEPHLP